MLALQVQIAAHINASEEQRGEKPEVWFGHKGQKPRNINDNRREWSLEHDIAPGCYVCVQCDKSSEYFNTARFEVARVSEVPSDVTSEFLLVPVEFHKFDP